jgi:hypothetical protein
MVLGEKAGLGPRAIRAGMWARFTGDGAQAWLMIVPRRRPRVWVGWGKVTSFEVSEAGAW